MTSKVNVQFLQPWSSWTTAFTCKLCNDGRYISFCWEFAYIPEGSTTSVHISEACSDCMRGFVDRDPEMQTRKYWDEHQTLFSQLCEYGLLSNEWMQQRGLKMTSAGVCCKFCNDDKEFEASCLGKAHYL